MRRRVHIFILFVFYSVRAQYNDPNFSKPSSGYGSDGSHTIGTISFTNPNYTAKDIEIYYPLDVAGKVPTIFYNHAFGGNNSANIIGVLNFVAQKGYAIVFVPYQTTGVTVEERYANLLHGFRLAARTYPDIIDTTRVGFIGYSFGGGAAFGNAFACINDNGWGANGRFIYALAQWYSFNISQSQLQSFPADVKVLIEVFEDDETNDHRMAIDIFNSINISSSEKDFILLKSDTINSYIYAANHNVPNTVSAWDALDYYAYYRFIDALADYTFNGSAAGKLVALGNGGMEQISMPAGLKNLVQSDNPLVQYSESKYLYSCSDAQNPRSAYCPQMTIIENETREESISVYPNPTLNFLQINTGNKTAEEMNVYNSNGQCVYSCLIIAGNNSFDVSAFRPGLYFLKTNAWQKIFVKE